MNEEEGVQYVCQHLDPGRAARTPSESIPHFFFSKLHCDTNFTFEVCRHLAPDVSARHLTAFSNLQFIYT